MCVGADDGMIFVYSVTTKFKTFKRLKGRYTRVTHIDYSLDSKIIQFNNESNELLFFDLETAKRVKNDEEFLKNEKWATLSCVLGWASKGIWAKNFNGFEIAAVDRTLDKKILVSGDYYGEIKLFKYPSYIESNNLIT